MVKRINSRLYNPKIKEMIRFSLEALHPRKDFHILYNDFDKRWVAIVYNVESEGYRTYKVIDSEKGINGFEFIETESL